MDDSRYMQLAIDLAQEAMGHTHPNPAVGAVVRHGNEVAAGGYTQPAGQDHAEIVALKAFAEKGLLANDSTTLYVTLEPCCTQGQTPPCTSAIIESGIRRVVVGATDPNPHHNGRGIEILQSAGLEVKTGILEDACTDLNLIFNWRMRHGSPLFAGKIATTIDGRIATRGGASKWITGKEARQDVHFWRGYFPAIAVGAGTVISDDPSLTIRMEGQPVRCPVRFIFDRNLSTFHEGSPKVYNDQWSDRTIVVCSKVHADKVAEMQAETGIQFWMCEDTLEESGMDDFARRCGDNGIWGVYFEGGARLLSSLIRIGRLHYLFAYRAPKLLADRSALAPFLGMDPVTMKDALYLEEVRHGQFGDDQLTRGFLSNRRPTA